MFDPTAFENIKVVLEGALYDLDLSGDIIITDRNDLLNTAKLSRCFDISFTLANKGAHPVTAKLSLESKLKNLAAELLAESLSESLAGSYMDLKFIFNHKNENTDFRNIAKILVEIWGSNRKITIHSIFDPLAGNFVKSIATVEFARLIREEQLDDLREMIEFMKITLQRLESLREL
ncbi:hypothetical protein ACF5W4_10825 [Bacillota bacterium Lsc_1132]